MKNKKNMENAENVKDIGEAKTEETAAAVAENVEKAEETADTETAETKDEENTENRDNTDSAESADNADNAAVADSANNTDNAEKGDDSVKKASEIKRIVTIEMPRPKGIKMEEGMVVGVDVVSEERDKKTINLQLDAKKVKKAQNKQLREEKKRSRQRAVKEIGRKFGDRIREGVKDEAPKTTDKDMDIRACRLEMSFINVITMILVFAVLAITLIVIKRADGKSRFENRELADFPEISASQWLSGNFTDGVTKWYTDTIPYRDDMLSLSSRLTKLFGLHIGNKEDKVILDGNRGDIEKQTLSGTVTTQKVEIFTGTQPSQTTDTETSGEDSETTAGSTQSGEDTTTTTTTTTTPTPTQSTPKQTTLPVDKEDATLSNGIMIVGSGKNVRALECYGGSFAYGKTYAEFVNKYKKELGKYVNVYNMNIPTAFAYYCPEKYKKDYGNTLDNINNIRSYLDGVADVDVYSVLNKHTNEYIYSRTDHHWQPLGAYYAAQEFAKVSQVPFDDLSTYEKVVEEDFVGTLYGFSGYNSELADNPDSFTYYKPSNTDKLEVNYYDINFQNPVRSQLFFKAYQKINLYSTFLGTDQQIAEIKTDCDNGRTLVIFKDSFGNALVPFLTGSYSKIYVVDLRYFTPNAIEFCQNVGATDVLFATCMFTCTGSKANYIENIRVQNKTR